MAWTGSMNHHPPNNRPYHQNAVSLPPFSNHGPYAGSSVRQHHNSHQPQRPSYFSMDSNTPAGEETAPLTGDASFDILDWHPAYQSCQRYFLDYAQHEPATQALCALINIKLPFQWLTTPITSANPNNGLSPAHSSQPSNGQFTFSARFPSNSNQPSPSRSRQNGPRDPPTFISLVPYIRRLVITGFDKPSILHGFFGDDYTRGVLPHVDCERRNYLFAAKHGGWRTCKKQYDTGSGGGGDDETVPFMKPLEEAKIEELNAAEKAWSGWLAMEDWMVGPRAPEEGDEYAGQAQAQSGSGARSGQMPDGLPDGDHRRM